MLLLVEGAKFLVPLLLNIGTPPFPTNLSAPKNVIESGLYFYNSILLCYDQLCLFVLSS